MKTLLVYLLIGGSAVIVGTNAGVIAKCELVEPARDYSNVDMTVYKVNADEYFQKVDSYGSKENAFNFAKPEEIVIYSLEKYKLADNAFSFGYGLANADAKLLQVPQVVRSCLIKNEGKVFEESLSWSNFTSVGNRYVQEGKGQDVKVYIGSVVTDGDVLKSYSYTEEDDKKFFTVTAEEYASVYGREPVDIFNYVIHPDLVINADKSSDETGYTIQLSLNADLCTFYYQHQMQKVSDLGGLPVFAYENLTFKLDKDFNLKNMIVDEKYQAVMGVSADITAHITYEYHINEKIDIPTVDEYFDYDSYINK